MISTLSKQGGRRYPQMGSAGLAFHGWLPGIGGTATPSAVTIYGSRIPRARRDRERRKREEEEIIKLLPRLISRIEGGES